jgi:hypothetical protein
MPSLYAFGGCKAKKSFTNYPGKHFWAEASQPPISPREKPYKPNITGAVIRTEVEHFWEFRLIETGIVKVPQVSWKFKLLAGLIWMLIFIPAISIPLVVFYPNGISDPILGTAFIAFVLVVPTVVFLWLLYWRRRKVAGISTEKLLEWKSARVIPWSDVYSIVITSKKLLIDTETKQYRTVMRSDFSLTRSFLRERIGERLIEET